MVTVGKNNSESENRLLSQTSVKEGQDEKNNDIHQQLFGHRKQREFIAESEKDETYWDRRRRNNEAAKRSREKRRVNDMMLESRVMELTKENSLLRAQLEAIYDHYEVVSRTGGVMTLPPLPRALANIIQPATTQIHPRIRVAHIPARRNPYEFSSQGGLPAYPHQDQRFVRRLGGWGETPAAAFRFPNKEAEIPRDLPLPRDLQLPREIPREAPQMIVHPAPVPVMNDRPQNPPLPPQTIFRSQTEVKPETERISMSPRHYDDYEGESEVLNLSSEATKRPKVTPEQSLSPASIYSTSGGEDEAYHSSNASSPISSQYQPIGGHLPHKLRFKTSPSFEDSGSPRKGYKRTQSDSEHELMDKRVKQEI